MLLIVIMYIKYDVMYVAEYNIYLLTPDPRGVDNGIKDDMPLLVSYDIQGVTVEEINLLLFVLWSYDQCSP